MTLFGNRVVADIISSEKMRSYWSRAGSESIMIGVLNGRGKETEIQTKEGRMPCEDSGRN